MKRILHFLSSYINQEVIESKVHIIKDAFRTDVCFDDVPEKPGIYIMIAKESGFIYPYGKSAVFYIGTSKDLKKRLKTHLRLYNRAKNDYENHNWHYSRYNYAIAFGADIYFMRITGRENEKDLESKAIEGFYDKYGALPVGNGAFSFRT